MTIEIINLSKYYPPVVNKTISYREVMRRLTRTRLDNAYCIFQNLNCIFEKGKSYAILGRNGAGKSTLINLIAGIERYTSGKIVTHNVSVSWPVGNSGSFQSSLTARENINFITRIYQMTHEERLLVLDFCRSFADIGEYFDMPISSYSSGMKARVSFAISMACDFDRYILDEVTATGDRFFVQKAKDAIMKKLEMKDFIIVSHNIGDIRDLCDIFGVIVNRNIVFFDNFNEAWKLYQSSNS